ncbi:MAG: hypothetical protein HOA15_04650 [Candidatus Marinimicrobia bacterium]|nr:hypothetical protein [Candidatus Neomarinimicrobiota bacterium]MBT3675870.1 hypothetical protein [Candidatus Neomarinimicrobiota bacterium]MBT3763481.1 hypothetical protein [Candidatus Neomarinimicrobiota bacterium]MBT4068569.1 hypothetical protein [Candidatus Neomarinimicrobiota bacterium]MBT4271565.1 hypothetical protein [Candidatus Neomarinimicrobiota bacterium]
MNYHVWWPGQGNDPMYLANTNMNRTRNNYYGNNYTPHMFTNGKDSGSNTTNWKNDPKDYLDDVGFYGVTIAGTQSGNDISFDVYLDAIKSTTDSRDLRLFVAAVMDTVKYDGSANGLKEHHNAVIELLTGDTGKNIKLISGVVTKESFSWTMRNEWLNHPDFSYNMSGLKAVAWIQDYSSKEILQVNEFNFK